MRALAGWVPYLAVGVGLYMLHSGWAAMAGYHVLMVLFLWAGGGWSGIREILRGWSWKEGIPTCVVCGLAGPLLWMLWPVVSKGPLAERLAAVGLEGASWWGFVVYYALVNPVLEELYWRGWLGSESRWPGREDVLFAGYHGIVLVLFVDWPWALLCFACLLTAAWLWRQLVKRHEGLAIPVISHFIADVGVVVFATVLI
jgi:membrane protease YdiL (CAAX protease family)